MNPDRNVQYGALLLPFNSKVKQFENLGI